MQQNQKDSKADAQLRGHHRRIVERRRQTQRDAHDASMRRRLSAVRPDKNAPARGSVAARDESRFTTGRERVLADDGSAQVVATTGQTVLRLQHHRQRAATGFMRDWETMLGGLHSASLEFRPRSTAGDFGHARRIEAGARIREVKRHVGNGFAIMVAVLVCGVPIGEIASAAKVAMADVHRDLNNALDYAADVYAPGRGWLPKWMTRLQALAERKVPAIVARRAY
ncbi:MAG TPA: hypothetical protein VGG11_19190 [Xanthobacteraceae bacterium]|jgi:hypothetical protein